MVKLSKLETQISSIVETMAGALQRFGELGAAGNKQWTLFARITSGSWAWRFQARLRAMSNFVEIMNNAQKKANKEMIDGIKIRAKLDKALKSTKKQMELIEAAQPLSAFDGIMEALFKGDEIMAGLVAETKDWTVALQRAHNFYKDINEQGQKAEEMNKKGMIRYYADRLGIPKISDVKKRIDSLGMQRGEGVIEYGKRLGKGAAGLPVKLTMRVLKTYGKIGSKLGKFATLGMQFFKPALLYGSVILLGLMVFLKWIMKAGPYFAEIFSKVLPMFLIFFEGIWNILKGLFNIIAGIWKGDMGQIWKGLGNILYGVVQVISAGIAIAFGTLLAILTGIWMGVLQGIRDLGRYIRGIFGFASGGVAQGNLNIVGEKGPELVRLPAGSRVISNANSRGMGGNTINVHVNGRVGASDAEIRDIANKVAREINIRMNRQGTTTMGG